MLDSKMKYFDQRSKVPLRLNDKLPDDWRSIAAKYLSDEGCPNLPELAHMLGMSTSRLNKLSHSEPDLEDVIEMISDRVQIFTWRQLKAAAVDQRKCGSPQIIKLLADMVIENPHRREDREELEIEAPNSDE